LHLRLLKAWNALPKLDSYAWQRAAYHLVNAGHKDDLRRLLLDFGYLQSKLAATDPNALIADFDYLADDEALRLIQSALRLSVNVLVRDQRQLAGQVMGRLMSQANPQIETLVKQAEERKPWTCLLPLRPNLPTPGGPLIRTLEGHSNVVTSVAITPDGDCVLSASWDRTLRLWDLKTGQTLRTFEGHTDWVNTVAITPDGFFAVSGSGLNLWVWDLKSGRALRTFQGREWIRAVAVLSHGRRAVSASGNTLYVWDLERGRILSTLTGHGDWVEAVAITPDGSLAVSASRDHTVRLWDLDREREVRTFEGHTGFVMSVLVTPDGRRVLSGSYDETLRLWDLESGQTLRTLESHGSIEAVAITPDGNRAISGGIRRPKTVALGPQ
jgi:WD40 repeat protein